VPPPPPRKKTRPTRAAREKRLEGKAIRSTVKKLRGRVGED
jgi:ribosome-associated protein